MYVSLSGLVLAYSRHSHYMTCLAAMGHGYMHRYKARLPSISGSEVQESFGVISRERYTCKQCLRTASGFFSLPTHGDEGTRVFSTENFGTRWELPLFSWSDSDQSLAAFCCLASPASTAGASPPLWSCLSQSSMIKHTISLTRVCDVVGEIASQERRLRLQHGG